jgi:ATP-dependent DNA ligase
LPHTQLIMPKRNGAERRNDNTGNSRCGIDRHSTLWLKPALVGQFEFVEWTPDGHLRHPRFMGLRETRSRGELVGKCEHP